jgi:hypothetical protein
MALVIEFEQPLKDFATSRLSNREADALGSLVEPVVEA